MDSPLGEQESKGDLLGRKKRGVASSGATHRSEALPRFGIRIEGLTWITFN